jgi:deoxyribose-phosphate aldolase
MSAHEKLNDDATGTGQNLDQVLYFGLQEQLLEIAKQQAQKFAKHGLNEEDILIEMRSILSHTNDELLNDTQSTQTRQERQ